MEPRYKTFVLESPDGQPQGEVIRMTPEGAAQRNSELTAEGSSLRFREHNPRPAPCGPACPNHGRCKGGCLRGQR